MFAVNCIGGDALLLLVDCAPVSDIAREASFTVGGKITSGEVNRQRVTKGLADCQQLGLTRLIITQTLTMATKPEFDQLGEMPAITRFLLPLQPRLTLIRVQHKTLKRQCLPLGGEALSLAGAITTLRVDFDKP